MTQLNYALHQATCIIKINDKYTNSLKLNYDNSWIAMYYTYI